MLESGRNNSKVPNNTSHPSNTPTHVIIAEAKWRLSKTKTKIVDARIDQDKFVSLTYFDGSICQPPNKNTIKLKRISDKEDLV